MAGTIMEVRARLPVTSIVCIIMNYVWKPEPGKTIQHTACKYGYAELVEQWVRRTSPAEVGYDLSLVPAAENGHYEIVKMLLSTKHVGPHVRADALARAAWGGHVNVVGLLIDEGAQELDRALRCARGNTSIIALLLLMGAKHSRDGFGRACESGNMAAVNMLVGYGANYWNAGLCGACRGGHMHIAENMIERGANVWNAGLISAAAGGKLCTARAMLGRGATHFNRAIKMAANAGHTDMVIMLTDVMAAVTL